MSTNSNFTNEYFEILDQLNGDIESRKNAFRYMDKSTAIVHHQVVACSFIPRLFNQKTYDAMKKCCETTHRILCKVMQHYLDCPSYRDLFDFDEKLKKLILLPRGYDSILPFARIDTFLDEDNYTLKFCEFNGDGSAGMNENREITTSISNSKTMDEFRKHHNVEGCALFGPWVDDFIEIYNTYEHKVENPTFAICDYLDHGVVDEFYVYVNYFADRGYKCIVCDVRELSFDSNVLKNSEGVTINAIWRRCVTNDVLEYWDESQALIEAVAQEKVALIGSFAGHIVHDKQIFDVLLKNETTEILTADEIQFLKETLPKTEFLDSAFVDIDEIRNNKDAWIIKPSDHYGADNVYAGCEVDQTKWNQLIDEFANNNAGYPFIVQQYIHPYKTKTLPPDFGILEKPDNEVETNPEMYNNLNGLYIYNGKFQGVFSRLGPHPTISKPNGGMTAATIWVDTKTDCGQKI